MIVPYQNDTVRNTDLPSINNGARATADSFGGGQAENIGAIGNAAQNLGHTVEQIGLEEQDTINHDIARKSVNDARLELSSAAMEEYAKNGSDAFGATERLKTQAQKISEKYSGSMQTMAQQDIFNNVFSQYAAEHEERATQHEIQQKEVFRNQTLDQDNEINADEITASMSDPKIVESRLFDIAQNVRSMSKGRGDQDKRVEGVVRGVLMNAIAEKALTDPVTALTFLEAHQDKLKPAQAMTMRDNLQKKLFDMRKADIIMKETAAPGATRESVIEKINATSMPAMEKMDAIKDAMVQFDVVDGARDKDKREHVESQWNQFYQKPDLQTIAAMNIDPIEKHKMTETLSKMTKTLTNEEYAQNLGKIQRMTTDEFLKLNIDSVRYDIAPDQVARLRTEQATLRKEGKVKSPMMTKALEDAKTEASRMSPFNIDAKKDNDLVKGEKDKRLNEYMGDYASLLSEVPDEMRNDPKIRDSIKNRLLKEKINKGWFWDSPSGKVDYTPLDSPPTKEQILQNKAMPDAQKAASLLQVDDQAGNVPHVNSRDDFDKLPKGSPFFYNGRYGVKK